MLLDPFPASMPPEPPVIITAPPPPPAPPVVRASPPDRAQLLAATEDPDLGAYGLASALLTVEGIEGEAAFQRMLEAVAPSLVGRSA